MDKAAIRSTVVEFRLLNSLCNLDLEVVTQSTTTLGIIFSDLTLIREWILTRVSFEMRFLLFSSKNMLSMSKHSNLDINNVVSMPKYFELSTSYRILLK